jgi:benzodiazapine receptor
MLARLLLCIVVCQLAGGIGALFTGPAIPTWYATIAKPAFNPPSWLFGPVWITLYVVMAVAAFLVWQRGLNVPAVRTALALFGAQLILNAAWSGLFFGLRSPLAGLVDIVALLALIVATIVAFGRVSALAAWLLVPYLAWVAFATVLNATIWWLNR